MPNGHGKINMTTKKVTTRRRPQQSRAIIVQQVKLPDALTKDLKAPTPPDYIRTRKGKGGQQFTYVPGYYVVMKLNEAFGPFWEFRVVEHKVEEKEVYVLGRLTIKDFKTGNEINKEQFGTKERIQKNGTYASPVGDVLKSASTDALKKCASMLGVALDVYSGMIEAQEEHTEIKTVEPIKVSKSDQQKQNFEKAKQIIQACRNIDILADWDAKFAAEKTDLYTGDQTKELRKLISNKVDQLINSDGKEEKKTTLF